MLATAGAPVGMWTWGHAYTKFWAATLALFQPGGTYHAHCILMSPPSFESHSRACYF